MVIGVCTIELHIPDQGSLKGKRQVLLSLKDRVRQKFNVSIAELDAQELWQRTVLGVACIGNEKRHINRQMDHASLHDSPDAFGQKSSRRHWK
jgi:uncharacterized protein YlxP (DUF503 family)